MSDIKNIVIVGGGYGAVAAATRLDKMLGNREDVRICLITKTDRFYHNLGSFRTLVEPEFAEKIHIPYDHLFRKSANGRVIQGNVVDMDSKSVVLEDGTRIEFDYAVIATGSSYPSPSKTSKTKGSESIQELRTIASAIQSATCVLIVGGGPVGIETAGEIATDYPTKSVTLIHSGSALMPGPTSDKFKSKVLTALRKKGVEVVLGERVEGLEGLFPDPVEKGWAGNGRDIVKVKTDKGREVGADVVVLATGNARYNSGFVKRLGEGLLEREQIRVRPTLQLDDNRLSNIFAIGDVTNIPLKFAYYAGEQGTIAADNIVKLIKNGDSSKLSTFTSPSYVTAIVSIGRNGGVAQLFGVWGDWLVKSLKSGDLFTKRYWGILGAGDEYKA